MNRKQIIAAALFAAVIGSSAFAVEAEQVVVPQGALTRAEVQAELARARAAGELAYANESYGGVKEQTSLRVAAPSSAWPPRAAARKCAPKAVPPRLDQAQQRPDRRLNPQPGCTPDQRRGRLRAAFVMAGRQSRPMLRITELRLPLNHPEPALPSPGVARLGWPMQRSGR